MKNKIASLIVGYFPANLQEDVWACFEQRGRVKAANRESYPAPQSVLSSKGLTAGWSVLCIWQDRPWFVILGLVGLGITLGRMLAHLIQSLLA